MFTLQANKSASHQSARDGICQFVRLATVVLLLQYWQAKLALTLPYLTFGANACYQQTPSAEATARAQCASPTDLKVDRTSLKLCQTSGGDAIGYHSAYPVEE